MTLATQRIADVRFTIEREVQNDPYEGLLEVFLDTPDGQQWTAVCFDEAKVQFNDGSAAAACRQKGFDTFTSYGPARGLG